MASFVDENIGLEGLYQKRIMGLVTESIRLLGPHGPFPARAYKPGPPQHPQAGKTIQLLTRDRAAVAETKDLQAQTGLRPDGPSRIG